MRKDTMKSVNGISVKRPSKFAQANSTMIYGDLMEADKRNSYAASQNIREKVLVDVKKVIDSIADTYSSTIEYQDYTVSVKGEDYAHYRWLDNLQVAIDTYSEDLGKKVVNFQSSFDVEEKKPMKEY